ncbi:MAG: hypothetical protein EDR02_18715 [Actinobacteria bacterium]|nr:MAG: hypothetical protein EDR02_18715 [Actinomycetota bacterium]
MQLTPPTEWTHLATHQDLANLETRLGARMDGLEADLRASEARLIGELHRPLRLQTIWLIGAIFTLAALILTAAKYL